MNVSPNWPNRISLARLVLIAPYVLLLLHQQQWPAARYFALGLLAVMALSDILDGVLARALNARTRLGAILDPLADKALIISSVVLLSLERAAVPESPIRDWVVVAVVGKDLWVVIGFMVVYFVTDRFRIQPTIAGKASTVGQLVMVLAVLLAPDLNRLGRLSTDTGLGSDIALALQYVVVALCIAAVMSYTRLGLRFVAAEEKPLENHPDSRKVPIKDESD